MRLRLALALGVLAFAACKCPGRSSGAVDAGQPADAGGDAFAGLGDEPVRPVYDINGPIDPRAQRYCDALYTLPARRRAECCHATPFSSPTDLCARTFSAALRAGGVALDEAQLAACETAEVAEHQGCDWVGPTPPLPPPPCAAVLTGKLPTGARCRSSLECQGALRCQGSGPTDLGICGPARESGTCGTAVDALAGLLQINLDRSHPACAGYCDHYHCGKAKAEGEACTVNLQCARGTHCGKGVCEPGDEAPLGAPCLGAPCAGGARCTGGVCALPKAAGEACHHPFECRGGCLMGDAGQGTCGMRCDSR